MPKNKYINFPKKMRESGIPPPPKKKAGNKKHTHTISIWPSSEESWNRCIVESSKDALSSLMPPCKLVFFATLVPRFVSQALFAWRAPWQKHEQSWVLKILQIWKKAPYNLPKATFGIEVLILVLHHLHGIFGHLWRSLNSEMLKFWQWKVALLTWRKPTRFKGFFNMIAKQHALDKSCKSSFR